jgi:hypothetical protein
VSDVWRRTPAGFRLVASQVFALLRDPPRIELTEAALDAYAGTYELAPDARARVRREADHLVAERDGRPAQPFVPELVDVFFTPGRARTRRIFQRDASGRITGPPTRQLDLEVAQARRAEHGGLRRAVVRRVSRRSALARGGSVTSVCHATR